MQENLNKLFLECLAAGGVAPYSATSSTPGISTAVNVLTKSLYKSNFIKNVWDYLSYILSPLPEDYFNFLRELGLTLADVDSVLHKLIYITDMSHTILGIILSSESFTSIVHEASPCKLNSFTYSWIDSNVITSLVQLYSFSTPIDNFETKARGFLSSSTNAPANTFYEMIKGSSLNEENTSCFIDFNSNHTCSTV